MNVPFIDFSDMNALGGAGREFHVPQSPPPAGEKQQRTTGLLAHSKLVKGLLLGNNAITSTTPAPGHATPPQAADTSNISYFSTQKQPTNPVHATSSISEFTLAKDIPKSSASTTSKSSSRPRPKPAWKKAEQDKENQSPSDIIPSIAERAKMRSQMRTSSSMISDTASFAAGTAPIDRTSSPPLGLAAGGILQETLGKPAAPILVEPTPLSNVPETPQEKAEKPKKKRKASDPGDEGKKKKKKKSSADTVPSKGSEVPTYKSNEFISSSQAEEDVPLPPAVIPPQFEIPPSPPPLVPPAHDDELNIRDKDRPVSWNTLAPPKHSKEGESGTKPTSKPVGPKSSSSKAVPKPAEKPEVIVLDDDMSDAEKVPAPSKKKDNKRQKRVESDDDEDFDANEEAPKAKKPQKTKESKKTKGRKNKDDNASTTAKPAPQRDTPPIVLPPSPMPRMSPAPRGPSPAPVSPAPKKVVSKKKTTSKQRVDSPSESESEETTVKSRRKSSKATRPSTPEQQHQEQTPISTRTPEVSSRELSPPTAPTPPPKPREQTAAPPKAVYETPKNANIKVLRDSYTVPARTKVSMTALLQKLNCHSPSASPSALKLSRRAVGKIAPLHPNRKPPPAPPPRVVRQEKKSKAQRDMEEQWEMEWEDQYGEEWFSIPEEEKAKMRRERRDREWNDD
ncbi:hypothetical protein SISNIDRAFT_495216 [Sistotremastrum niveocremeum HHB9708]|uniref:Uncharacterized protein n=1 Tax=Sistotremastrum niveocremeum HHB9708 TaxID=1314777 RepID=A0A164VIL9_9AGAM|nr:hypothetical protein SISNIDRAFT_495216 [Sistotremastrum niveocremeum HHB9708]